MYRQLNLLVFDVSSLMKDLIQLDHRLPEEHVHPNERPVHYDEDQLVAPGWIAATPAVLQHAGVQLERALLPPLRLGSLLQHAVYTSLVPCLPLPRKPLPLSTVTWTCVGNHFWSSSTVSVDMSPLDKPTDQPSVRPAAHTATRRGNRG
ncbi:hypothetical protein FQN60_007200 [Etheostoma spectabile]|uniref:Uncharacterized protein n=1 Tax=Etheostoma spectabile TaxID=54343 RepID=A0A5J5CFV3_9PERO|nr:hypothetical protein FQN60_007200 [Etheostoma spectabile]